MGVPAGKRRDIEKAHKYRVLTGFWCRQRDVDAVGDELHRMEKDNGTLNQMMVVDKSKSATKYPTLHSYIWAESDEKVAYRWRLMLAKEIITSIVEITTDEKTGTETQRRPFVVVDDDDSPVNPEAKRNPGDSGQRYRSRELVDVDKLREVRLGQALEECRSFVRRFNDLEEVVPVVRAMTKVIKEHGED